MDTTADIVLKGNETGFGGSISTAGDINADGNLDIIVGSQFYDKAYIYINLIPTININLKVLIEGFYSTVFNQLSRKDTIVLYLRNVIPPFALVDSSKGTIDSMSLSGSYNFLNAPNGTYYIIAKHFNCLETWSKLSGEILVANGIPYNYDFTSSSVQAYGNNLKLKGSNYCLYSGDINQDGFITLFDVIPIYNDASNFVIGRFKVTDLTGDNIVDLTDVTICYNNSANFVGIIRP